MEMVSFVETTFVSETFRLDPSTADVALHQRRDLLAVRLRSST
jgi:hypothetical protein